MDFLNTHQAQQNILCFIFLMYVATMHIKLQWRKIQKQVADYDSAILVTLK